MIETPSWARAAAAAASRKPDPFIDAIRKPQMSNKCLDHDCKNASNQGNGRDVAVIGKKRGEGSLHWICEPCWQRITKGEDVKREDTLFTYTQFEGKTIRSFKGEVAPGMKFWWAKGKPQWCLVEVESISEEYPPDPWIRTKVLQAGDQRIVGKTYGNDMSYFRECVEPYEESQPSDNGSTNDATHSPASTAAG